MFRRQAFCVCAPLPGQHAVRTDGAHGFLESDVCRDRLRALFDRVGFVHFGTLVLLPPGPEDDPYPVGPHVVLELAIDPWLGPAEALRVLASADRSDGILRDIFLPNHTADDDKTIPPVLTEHLLSHCSRAWGGFVGTRDRSVGQIRDEATLHTALRGEQARRQRNRQTAVPANRNAPPAPLATPPAQTRSITADLRAWLGSQVPFAWTATASPRSFWRKRSLHGLPRVALASLASVLPALVALIGLSGVLVLAGVIGVGATAVLVGPAAIGVDVFGGRAAGAWRAIALTLAVFGAFAAVVTLRTFGILSNSAAFAATVVLAMVFVITPFVFDFHAAIGLLNRWGAIILAVTVLMIAVLAIAGVVALTLAPVHLGVGVVVVVFGGLASAGAALLLRAIEWAAGARAGIYLTTSTLLDKTTLPLGMPGMALVWLMIFATFAAMVLLAQPIGRWIERNSRRVLPTSFVRHATVFRAMQTHPSIEQAEAGLVGHVNHMISLADIRRPLWLFRPLLKATLLLIGGIGHVFYIHDRLGNASGIHFGHWHIVDEGRRLLFLSNYDGSFGGYLDDFILGASPGVNLIWRCTELRPRAAARPGHPDVTSARTFPPTRLGIFGGCQHEQWFKTYARDSMLPHLARYEAYRLTCREIDRNTQLRDALAAATDDVTDDIILRASEC